MKNILVITYWNYHDALIQAYTLPYVRIMQEYLPKESKVYLLTQEKDHSILKGGKAEAIRSSLPSNVVWVPFAYHRFGFRAVLSWPVLLAKLSLLIVRKKVSVIHAWATPAGAIGYLLSILTRRKLVVDSYEPHAESMVENGTWKSSSLAFRVLFRFERLQSKRAWWIISATEGMRSYARKKYDAGLTNFKVKPACVDLGNFSQKNVKQPSLLASLGLTGKIVCVYAGKYGGIYYDEEIFLFLKYAHEYWGERFRALLLTSHSSDEVYDFCRKVGLDKNIVITRFVPHADIADYVGLGDFALNATKPVPSKRYCTPIKDGEYWALGLPVVIARDISDDADIIADNDIGIVIDRYDADGFKKAIAAIDRLLQEPADARFRRIRAIAEKYRNFSVAHDAYRAVYRDDFK